MGMQYIYASRQLPESKMRLYPTKVINIIGGPACEKSLFSSAIILHLHLHHKTVEQIPDFAKSLVWQMDYAALKNQYAIAQQQYAMLDLLDGQVQYLVNECSLPQLLYYNEHYPDNICDVAKTRLQILDWYGQFDNINLLVERGEQKYLRGGRLQDEEGALEVDRELRHTLDREHIAHTIVRADIDAINAFASALV